MEKGYESDKDNTYYALLRMIDSEKCNWAQGFIYDQSISRTSNESDTDIAGILSRTDVWNQLLNSSLDLENARMILLDEFSLLNYRPGFIIFDKNSEYYLSPFSHKYEEIIPWMNCTPTEPAAQFIGV